VQIKGKYAFVDYEDAKDAKEAIEAMDGKSLRGADLTVQATRKSF
jgi:RNA recognition motif-containing protein